MKNVRESWNWKNNEKEQMRQNRQQKQEQIEEIRLEDIRRVEEERERIEQQKMQKIIQTPTHQLEIGMIMRYLCSRQSLTEFYSDRLECLYLNLLLHKHVLRHQWSLGNYLELTESFYPDGMCGFGICLYFNAVSYCQCWPRVEVITR